MSFRGEVEEVGRDDENRAEFRTCLWFRTIVQSHKVDKVFSSSITSTKPMAISSSCAAKLTPLPPTVPSPHLKKVRRRFRMVPSLFNSLLTVCAFSLCAGCVSLDYSCVLPFIPRNKNPLDSLDFRSLLRATIPRALDQYVRDSLLRGSRRRHTCFE